MYGQTSDMWYTPEYVLKAIRSFMPNYFDPCPANPTEDGLELIWGRNSFINPPYSNPLRGRFCDRGGELFDAKTDRYLWLLNNGINKDTTFLHKHSTATCVPFVRIKFIPGHPDLGDGKSPRYDSVFILWGDPTGFAKAFSNIGVVYTKGSDDE